ncbi:MAG: PepSY domain-containing protein [Tissierellia bacterium]|nr:PepSY domain-containing protein [Tissierellia bacterium]
MLEELKNKPVEKMVYHDHITRQEIEERKPIGLKPIFTLATAFCLLLIAYFGWYTPYMVADSIIYLDVNPSIEMSINRKEKVIDLTGINDEGKKLVSGIDYKNRDINSVVNELLDNMLQQNYIDKENHAILVSVLNKNLEKGNKKVGELNETINSYFKNDDIKPIVLRQSIVKTNTLEEFAEEYNISVGKMTFIKNLMILNPEFQLEDLVHLSLEELIKISREKGLDLKKIIDFDEDILEEEFDDDEFDDIDDDMDDTDDLDDIDHMDDIDDKKEDKSSSKVDTKPDNKDKKEEKKIISADEAKSIALNIANGKIKEFDLDEDDGRLKYEIEIKAKDGEHEIEIDAYTGKVLKHEIDD